MDLREISSGSGCVADLLKMIKRLEVFYNIRSKAKKSAYINNIENFDAIYFKVLEMGSYDRLEEAIDSIINASPSGGAEKENSGQYKDNNIVV